VINSRDRFAAFASIKVKAITMRESPPTNPSLIVRLVAQHDRAAWGQFAEIYAPLVFAFAQRRGLQDADAADVVQEVLSSVADAFRRGKYDRSRGLFRGWLLTIARHEVSDALAARARREQSRGGTTAQQALGSLPQPSDSDSEEWDREYHERLLAWAADRVRGEVQPTTWQAFWETTMLRHSGQDVATALGMSVAAVYLAKSRVMKRLRELVHEIDENAGPGVLP
jgi:RNA polymerase sigma factor (sigma-70 family)